jgi:putative hydrolase of the HAD superfamily
MLRYLLLDLDNTVYSETYGLEHEVLRRMTEFSARYLGLDLEETMARRRSRMSVYGTTLEWLMNDYGFTDVEGYFGVIHPEGEEEPLSPDPALCRLLDSIKLPKAIFTNAPREHAERILSRLGLSKCFTEIYDIRFNMLKGKPHADAVQRVCSACGVEAMDALFVDDVPRYVRGFIEAGGRGVLIDELDRHHEAGLPRIHSLLELPDILSEESRAAAQLGLFGAA